MILVTGAAGKTGCAIIRALSEQRAKVRALIYREAQSSRVESCGAIEVVLCDMQEVDAFIQAADGVKKMYHICPNMSPNEVEIGKNAIFAAKSAAVDQFVYHSVLQPQTQKMPHHWSKLQVEELLLESNLPFTIMQPTSYMQNVLTEWERIMEEGVYAVPYSVEKKLSMVDLDDVATAAARVLTEPGHLGATYQLCGPDMISAQDIARILGEKLGCTVETDTTPIEVWHENAESAGLGKYQIETLIKMFHYYDTYGFTGNERVLHYLLDRPPTDFRGFVGRVMRSRGIEV